MEIEAAGLSHPGNLRPNNEDSIGSHRPADPVARARKGALYALADGLGGHQAGEVASATAVAALIEEYYSPSNHVRIEPALRHALQVANLRVHDAAQKSPALRSMETTLTAVALAGCQAYVAHVGDSRAYLWRDGRLLQLTADHTEAAELVRLRIVPPERLATHPGRNVLTRTVGGRLIVRPDFIRQAVRPGDQLLLCSDGLWSEVSDAEMAEALAACEPAEACRCLLDLALSRECADNVSVQVMKVHAVTAGARGPRGGWLSGIWQRLGRGD